ncbi:unnamed protein product [Spirodela intermedia]|uniref:Uncharacterized protein n=1 Tax=Spirodela intermedia TaxID=51605 RepID=A0A7I8JIR0_SPIIN|nr:unnamed protein product [Spirodela intermedia]CAA6670036.1 unnamed protein product [Spirodela intermedia]
MKHFFEMSDLGYLCSYLGIEVVQKEAYITLPQRTYALKVLDFAKMGKYNPVQGTSVNSTYFRHLIGSLRYLTHTRLDLTYFVGFLSRFIEHPTEHLMAIKHVLRYLKGIIYYGLVYEKGHTIGLVYEKGHTMAELIGYSDNDFVGDVQDRKSTSGQVFFFGKMAISWASQKQKSIALSSCEAEYIVATTAACQGVWLNLQVYEASYG